MCATAVPVSMSPSRTGSATTMRLIDIKRPPDDDNVRPSHRHDGEEFRSPIGMVVAASLGVVLWHGGYRTGGQLLLAAVAAACVVAVRPRPGPRDLREPVVAGLALTAAANLLSLAWHGSGAAPAVAAVSVAVIAAGGCGVGGGERGGGVRPGARARPLRPARRDGGWTRVRDRRAGRTAAPQQ